jgi:hypothetical protein
MSKTADSILRAAVTNGGRAAVVVMLVAPFFIACEPKRAVRDIPPDRAMRARLAAHKGELLALRALVEQRPRISNVCTGADEVSGEGGTESGVPSVRPAPARLARIRALMQATGTYCVGDVRGETDFALWSGNDDEHWGPNQYAKGLTYAVRPPGRVLPTTEGATVMRFPNDIEVYSHIGGNWYVFLELGR